MWNSAQRGGFHFIFREFCSSVGGAVVLAGGWALGAGRWAIILWGLDSFLMFPNVLSCSATCEVTRIYHVYK